MWGIRVMEDIAVVVMAAGKGKRMKSDYPKVLHHLAGKPILSYILDIVNQIHPKRKLLIVGYQSEKVKELFQNQVEYVNQEKQLGTAHAVLQTRKKLEHFKGQILVLSGDTPFLKAQSLKRLLRQHCRKGNDCTLYSAIVKNPSGYGRIIRNQEDRILGIIEEADLPQDMKGIQEINAGIYCFRADALYRSLNKIVPDNQQKEYYLTDVVKILLAEGGKVESIILDDPEEASGINTRLELAETAYRIYQRISQKLMQQGVSILDPNHTYIEEGVKIGADTVIYPGTIIQGDTHIGSDCFIGPYTQIINSKIGKRVRVWASVVEESIIEDEVQIGPYAHLRPGNRIKKRVKIGNFVEVKKSMIGEGSKASHLTYLGDALIGKRVNIGAGTITCNYDGVKKNQTIIEDEAFIGSNNALVAPVKIGKKAYTGAGSTITTEVPPQSLGIARSPQRNIIGWKKRKKKD